MEHIDMKHTGEAAQALCGTALKLIAVCAIIDRDLKYGKYHVDDDELFLQACEDVMNKATHLVAVAQNNQ
jgi:hypothetical protein